MNGFVALLIFVALVAAYIWFKGALYGLVHRGVDEATKAVSGRRRRRWTIVPDAVPGETLHARLIEAMSEREDLPGDLEVTLVRRDNGTTIECSLGDPQLSDGARAETLRLARAIDSWCHLLSR